MAKELAHFKNFAKLKDTSLEFNDITVLAGKPSTGKSYVMKFMYALNNMFYNFNKKNLLNLEKDYSNLFLTIESLYQDFSHNDISDFYELLEHKKFDELYSGISALPEYKYKDIDLDLIQKVINKLKTPIDKQIRIYMINIINSIFVKQEQISSDFEVKYKEINYNYDFKLTQKNFEKKIPNIKNEPIFVETPLILEFKKFMPKAKGKTPYHIESLLNILDTNYSFTDIEQEEFIKNFTKKAKEIISGDIESSGDSFVYKTDTKNYDILNTSSGTKSIGLLQYLVTNKALKKGSILFWEEPEVHLHPQWQLKMIDLFVELMKAGVKIVFSTHSPYMADYLNAISQKNDFKDRVSFNVLEEKDGVVNNYILNDNNWNILQKELMDTFEDILWQYL